MKTRWASAAIGVLLGLICVTLAGVVFFVVSPNMDRFQAVPPEIKVIPAPTLMPSPTYGLSPEPTSTIQDDLPPDPGDLIKVGMNVRVSGTEGQGLRLRREAGINTTPIFLGGENEVFEVVDGPVSADGFTWWYLKAPEDSSRQGWAVSNYITPLE